MTGKDFVTCADCIYDKMCGLKCKWDREKQNLNTSYHCLHFKDKSLFIESPCKVGDTVYGIKMCFYLPHATKIKHNDIIPCEVIGIKKVKKGEFILLKPLLYEVFNKRSANKWFPFTAIGKTVFLTREEAEQALKKEKKE